jgi:hypothetical protein
MPLFGRLFDGRCYDTAFGVAAATPLVGFAAWWALNTSGQLAEGRDTRE